MTCAKHQLPLDLIPGYDPHADAAGCEFRPDLADDALTFFAKHLRHIEGAVAGQTFRLEPWQQAIVANLFGWVRRDAAGRTVRRYREAFIYVPRKNGKTPLVAGIALFVLFCDDELGQQNYIAAADREQAGMLFRHAKGMVEQDATLRQHCRIYGGNASAGQSRSIVRENCGSFLRVISADAETKHGGNPHLTIIDELHTQPDAELYDVLHTGMASQNRAQPLFISITTADYDRESVCNERHDYACGVRDGLVKDPSFLPVIFDADERTDDWTSPDVWRRCNPNLGVSVSEEYLAAECAKAIQIPRLQNTFKRLHLNMRTTLDQVWLDMDRWGECTAAERFTMPTDRPIYGGLDLSSKLDLTARAWAWREDGRVRVCVRCWVPEERVRERLAAGDQRYKLWVDEGWLCTTPGNVVDYEFILADVRQEAERCLVEQIGYDPWNATQAAIALQEADGLNMVEFRQGYASMNEPAKEFERLVTAGELEHEPDPVLAWMAGNTQVRSDPAGNIKPVKPEHGQAQKIDGIVAAIMAVGLLAKSPDVESAYVDRGCFYAGDI